MMILQVSPPTGHVVDNMSLHRKFSHASITSAQVPSCVHLPCWSGASDVLVALILVELGGHGHNLLQCQPRSVNIMLEFDDLSLLPPIPSTHLPCPCCLPRQICGSPRATCLLVELHQRTCHPNLHSMLSTSKLHQVLRKPRFQIPTLTVQDITTKPQPYTPCSSRYFWPAYFVFSNTSDNEDPNHLLPENTVQLWLSQLLPSAHFLPLNCQGSRNALKYTANIVSPNCTCISRWLNPPRRHVCRQWVIRSSPCVHPRSHFTSSMIPNSIADALWWWWFQCSFQCWFQWWWWCRERYFCQLSCLEHFF